MTIGSPDGSILRLNYWLVVESLFLNDYKKYDRYKKKLQSAVAYQSFRVEITLYVVPTPCSIRITP